MKNSILEGILFGCVISLTVACNEQKADTTATVVDKAALTKEIQAKEDEFASLYNAGELKNIGYYADDASSFYQNRPPLVGKDSIVAFLKSDLISNTDKISFKTNEIFPSADGGQVVEIGSFTVVDSANNPLNSGNYISLFEKRDGKYVCLRDMSASDRPSK